MTQFEAWMLGLTGYMAVMFTMLGIAIAGHVATISGDMWKMEDNTYNTAKYLRRFYYEPR